jgi:hypothetical protein
MLAAAAWLALSIVWGSNTVSHNHLHNPFFRSRAHNRLLSLYLSVLYAVPQSIWKERHLWHHAGEPERSRNGLARGAGLELACIAFVWSAVFAVSPWVLASFAIGYALGMALCRVQGTFEHARELSAGDGVSHYGRLYNFFWFNDGHHAEHHRWPGLHWTRLPERRGRISVVQSRLAPLWRGLEGLRGAVNRAQGVLLGLLERLPLAFGWAARFMVATHERAFRTLLSRLPVAPQTVGIIGGGLFPRTLLVLGRLLPEARIVVIDRSAENLQRALTFLDDAGIDRSKVEFRVESFDADRHSGFDLLVCPLGFVGDRGAIARVASLIVTHDWIFGSRGDASAIVSWLLLKRLSLHRPRAVARERRAAALCEAA